ncbi:hypothetical protein [Streptomyces poonensis]|uniref:Secreted protein n=1 Tax=Streptomyces poonensis TaxID=68255 RepID=A0A918PBH0_9ACTN|nr:hypothetical protein [Streptomyces poonensis]GGY97592.1 hypothetical protein GCM10010365_15060 [Streptomyces poonensis]
MVLGPLLLIAPLVMALAGAGSAQAACAGSDAQAVDTTEVAEQVESVLEGGGKATVSVPGLNDPAEQIPNARTIQATGVAMKVPARGQIVALATALQESELRNLMHDNGQHAGATVGEGHFPQAFRTALAQDPGAITEAYVYAVTVTGKQSIAWKGSGAGAESRSTTLAVQCRPHQDCALVGVLPNVAP